MPQLGLNGLNENWLLKECGHRHWTAICERAGVPSHRILDSQGNRLYAAFVSIGMSGSPLSAVNENDVIRFHTRLYRFSSKRFFSENLLTIPSGAQLKVEMVSIFVRKPVFDDNRSIAGSYPDPLRHIEQEPAPTAATEMLEAWKARKSLSHEPFEVRHDHLVCPTTDFNGARLLYFANFQHILDQAEWAALDSADMQFAATEGRRLYFYGNVNFDDVLTVQFDRIHWTGDLRSHRARVIRRNDGTQLAVVETEKRLTPRA